MTRAEAIADLKCKMQRILDGEDTHLAHSNSCGLSDSPAGDEPGSRPRRLRKSQPAVDDNAGLEEGESDEQRAFAKIIALLNASDKSEKALRERLAHDGFTSSAIEGSIERARGYGFIDDLRFADVLIRSRINQGRGRAGIERELKSHGIGADNVPGWPDEYYPDDDEELARALSFLERKPPHCKNLRDGAFRKLVQKGYTSSVASTAARLWYDEVESR